MWVLALVMLGALTVWLVTSERVFKRVKARFGETLGMDTFGGATAKASVPIVVSMTSSPSRVDSSLPRTLASIQSVSRDIRVVLPRKFRNKDDYDEECVQTLQATVVRIESDLGPLTKALPVLESVAQQTEDCVVLTLDDDATYDPNDLILLANAAHEQGRIATGFAKWDVVLQVWIPFGNNAVAYPKQIISSDFVATVRKVAEQGGQPCRMHDDMVLGFAAAQHGLGQPLVCNVRRNLLEQSFQDQALMYEFPDKDAECASMLAIHFA